MKVFSGWAAVLSLVCAIVCGVRGARGADTPPAAGIFAIPSAEAQDSVWLDGSGSSPVWAYARAVSGFTLNGRPEPDAHPTRAKMVRAGSWLLIHFDAVEPGGVVARESITGSELWFDDAVGVECSGPVSLLILINPRGSVWVSASGKTHKPPVLARQIRGASQICAGHWSGDLAIDTALLETDTPGLTLQLARQRQPRGLAPFEDTRTPALQTDLSAPARSKTEVLIAPRQLFSGAVQLDAPRVAAAPRAEDWARMPAMRLRDSNGLAAPPAGFQPAEVRAVLTPENLLLHVVCHEDNPESTLTDGDTVELFAGPEGFGYLQFIVTPQLKAEAVLGATGGRYVKPVPLPFGAQAVKAGTAQGWAFVMTVPIGTLCESLGLAETLSPLNHPWRVQVLRNRPQRAALGQIEQNSSLALTFSETAHCPERFARLKITEPDTAPARTPPQLETPALPPQVLTPEERKTLKPGGMLSDWVNARAEKLNAASTAKFEKIASAGEWNAHARQARTALQRSLFPPDGQFPQRVPLNVKTACEYKFDGFRCQSLVFETQQGLPAAAMLYLPLEEARQPHSRPALVMVPAHHTAIQSMDLFVLGANFARAGGVALAIDSAGAGERSVTAVWEHKTYQRNLLGGQLYLAGESMAGWAVWDVIRCADYLLERGDIDPKRLGTIGGVAGGGDISGMAAALDERYTACIPFNFSTARLFSGDHDPCRAPLGAQTAGLSPWLINSLIAPRALLHAQEFAWNKDCQDSFALSKKVYEWLKAPQQLGFLHGGANTHALHFAAVQRMPLYKILNRWWGLSLPENRGSEWAAKVTAEFESFGTAEGAKFIETLRKDKRLREPHELASEHCAQRLDAARARRAEQPAALRADLAGVLGDVTPVAGGVRTVKLPDWRGAKTEGLWLDAETGADLPKAGLAVWLLRPNKPEPPPLVLCAAQAGKDAFLAEHADEAESLLKAGIAVALLDVRGSGETAPGGTRFPQDRIASVSAALWMQSDSLPARQLKDVRTVLKHLLGRADIAASRFALWGEALTPSNGSASEPLSFDETSLRQCSAVPLRQAAPIGGWLALTGGLFGADDASGQTRFPRAVLARGTLAAFALVLERRYQYVPMDSIVPGLAACADMPDIVRALRAQKTRVILEDLRDGSNRFLPADAPAIKDLEAAGSGPVPAAHAIEQLIQALKE